MHIGITGYAKSGKDEVADILVADFDFVKVGMSDALDEYLLILDPWIWDDDAHGFTHYSVLRERLSYVEAKENPEVREMLQKLGTEVGRSIDEDIWIKEFEKRAPADRDIVTTGIRFQNEVDILDVLVWVNRDGVGPVNDHVSDSLEHIFAQAEHMIANDGTLNNLRITANRFGRLITNR